jgi:hypothetical protein
MANWPAGAHPLGLFYARSTLDCVIELASAVAEDFFQYSDIEGETKKLLKNLRKRREQDLEWPDLAERTQIYSAFVDPFLAKDPANVCACEVALRRTATTWVESDRDPNRSALRSAFIDAVNAFHRQLRSLESLTESEQARAAASMFDSAVAILRSPQVAKAFNLEMPPGGDWPYEYDENGSALVVAISAELEPPSARRITTLEFDIVQRLAKLRAETVSAVMKVGQQKAPNALEEAELEQIVEVAYRWEKTVEQCLVTRAVRAWRDVDYRALLAGDESGISITNPAGNLVVGDGGPALLELAHRAAACE